MRVWTFIAVLAVITAVVWGDVLRTLPPAHAGGLSVTWWQLAGAFYLAEVFAVHLLFRKQAHTISLTEVGLVVGLFFASPMSLLVAQVVGAAAALAFHRRQRPVKLAFNVVELSLCTGVALLVFRALAAPGDTSLHGWLIAILAAAVAHTTGVLLISAVIGIAELRVPAPQLGRTLALSLVATTTTACLGLAAVELIVSKPIALVLLTIPIAACVLAFRGYMAQREQRERVEFLYQSMRATHDAPEFGLAVGQLLLAARRLLRAEYAEILIASPGGNPPLRSVSGPDGELLMHHEPAFDPIDVAALQHVEPATAATLLSKRRPPNQLDSFVASRNLPEAIVGPLRGENGAFGLLLVGERGGDVSNFSATDLDLFETFAGHASVLLENGRLEHSLAQVTELKEQLRHQAYHDSLTGLPNRRHFAEELAGCLATSSPESPVAVLYLDLDRFKTVNDSWGHAAGDELLVEVAERIRQTVRPGDLPARLGGDEFAVLLRDSDAAGAELVAGRINDALDQHFELSAGMTTIHGSIGIAVSGPAGRTAGDLIRSADIAMYSAKAGKDRFAVYKPRLHSRLRREHRLALDLELALDRDEIVVHYQPIVSLDDGRLHALEALVRWDHPKRGLLLPDEFLPAAEESGLIVDIGKSVVGQAFGELGSVLEPGTLGLWLNLGPAELTGDRLIEDLAVALAQSGIDPGALTVEITESGVFRDEQRAIGAMANLRNLGVHLSIDDFGTGYSSLSRLAEFPIESVKIPLPFVSRLTGDDQNETFVDAIIRLADSLGLATVAEGIEHPAAVRRLRRLGCSLGQGYLFSKPLPAAELLPLLENPRQLRSVVSSSRLSIAAAG